MQSPSTIPPAAVAEMVSPDPAAEFLADLRAVLDVLQGGLARRVGDLKDKVASLPPAAVVECLDVLKAWSNADGRVEDWGPQCGRHGSIVAARAAEAAGARLGFLAGALVERLPDAAGVGEDPWAKVSDFGDSVSVQTVPPFMDSQLVAPLKPLPPDHPAHALSALGFATDRGPCVVLGPAALEARPTLVRLSTIRSLTSVAVRELADRRREAERQAALAAERAAEAREKDPALMAERVRELEQQLAGLTAGR